MTVMLATLCLNEMEWLPSLYLQHKDWPNKVHWVFVEAADRVFATTNPNRVSSQGLSVDGTTEFLQELAKSNPNITYIPFGFSNHPIPDMCKSPARSAYLEIAKTYTPTYLIILDADEFYTKQHQTTIEPLLDSQPTYNGYVFHRREIWYPPSIRNTSTSIGPTSTNPSIHYFSQEVVGGWWDMACCHWWRWNPDMHYNDCHVTPTLHHHPMNRPLHHFTLPQHPQMIHMGFASNPVNRLAKNHYYRARGEGVTDHRSKYVDARSAWEHWTPDTILPGGAKVTKYKGPIPEVFMI